MVLLELPSAAGPWIKRKFDAINKRAIKANIPGVTYKVSRTFEKDVPRYSQDNPFYVPGDTVKRPYIEISYTTEKIVIEGYEPVATLTWDHDEPIVYVWPDAAIPQELMIGKPVCDHCKAFRKRLKTFVLRNIESGKYYRVGSTCVRDFIGYDPSQLMEQARYLDLLIKIGVGEEWNGWLSNTENGYDLDELLLLGAAATRLYGWTSMAKARDMEGVVSTASYVMDWIDYSKAKNHLLRRRPAITDEDRIFAINAKNWAANL